jgi:hypothetical protein
LHFATAIRQLPSSARKKSPFSDNELPQPLWQASALQAASARRSEIPHNEAGIGKNLHEKSEVA